MTVVQEHQVKTIAAEIVEQFGSLSNYYGVPIDAEDVVRAVIAMYDISGIRSYHVPFAWERTIGFGKLPDADQI